MRRHILSKRTHEQKREDIRHRLDMYRVAKKPVCYIPLPDEVFALMRGDSLEAYSDKLNRAISAAEMAQLKAGEVTVYELVYGLKLVPFSERQARLEVCPGNKQVAA